MACTRNRFEVDDLDLDLAITAAATLAPGSLKKGACRRQDASPGIHPWRRSTAETSGAS